MSEYVIFQLLNGATIIGKKVESLQDGGDSITIANPAQIVPVSRDEVGMMPYLMFLKNDVVTFKTNSLVMDPAEPNDAIIAEHKKNYSPIVLPSSQIIGG